MASAAISGDYVDLKFVKGRKVAQIVIEIPIEAANAFVQAFGTPSPAEGVPVALARLQTADPSGPVTCPPEYDFRRESPPPRAPRRMNDLPLSQQAALLCDREAFGRFIKERFNVNPIGAPEFLRSYCGVVSRRDLQAGTPAAAKFFELKGLFDVWYGAYV